VNTAVGLIALHSGRTAEIIVLSVLGALTLYALAAAAQLVLRRREPELPRPFRTPFSPALPITALVLALVCLVAVVWFNLGLAALYAGLLGLGYGWYLLWVRPRGLSA
jgi:ethanolamine permease